jgi:hypothetical protein
MCGKNGIGGSGENFGDIYAHLNRIDVLYHEAMGGKYVLREVLFDLKPGVIGSAAPSRLSERSSTRKTS